MGSYVTDTNKVQVQSVSFDTTERDQALAAMGSSNLWTRFWDMGETLMYVALLVGGLFLVVRTFKNTSEEFIPTGITVGELMADRLATEGPAITAGAGMAMPEEQAAAGGGQAVAPTKVPEESEEDDVEMITQEKKKLVMDFGIGKKQPERVTVEVLKDLIEEKPEKMSQAARSWLLAGGESDDNL